MAALVLIGALILGFLSFPVKGDDGPVVTVPKAALPYVVTPLDSFIPANFPSAYCIGAAENAQCYVTMVQCADKAKAATEKRGKFFQSSCASVSCQTAVSTAVSITCATEDFRIKQTISFKLVVQDSLPTCQNMTYPITSGIPVIFQLRAGDADDTTLLYHIRQASFDTLRGTLEYCKDCGDDAENWQLYSKLLDESFLTKWSRKFRYTAPANITGQFPQRIQFTATDLSNNDCTSDGFVTFTTDVLRPPAGKLATYGDISVGVQQTIKISATPAYDQRLTFTLKTVPSPDCAILCTIPETARQALKVAPGLTLFGDALGSCTAATALAAGTDITMRGKSDTFAFRTFLTIRTFKVCQQSFDVQVAEKGVAGLSPSTVSFTSNAVVAHSCKQLTLTADRSSFRLSDVFDAMVGTSLIVSVLSGQATVDGRVIAAKSMSLADTITIPPISQTLRLEISSAPSATVPFDEFCSVVVGLPADTPQPPPPPNPSPSSPTTPSPLVATPAPESPVPVPAIISDPTTSANDTKARVLWFFVLVGFVSLALMYRRVIVSAARQLCGGGKYRPLGQEVEMGRR
jgi:hypothetical protein